MKLIFVENRQKTWFWDAIAGRLEVLGHDIHWVRQNPVFHGGTGVTHSITVPRGSAADQPAGPWFDEIAASDRHIRNFGGTTGHYAYYRQRLADVLDHVRPDAVIGETTLFHELLLVKLCRERSIPYLHPVSARYPEGRFFVFQYDSQRVWVESGNVIPDSEARRIAEAIGRRATVPYYMKRPMAAGAIRKQASLRLGHARILLGWMMGECFNTPSPLRRISMAFGLRRRLARWDALAQTVESGRKAILYPLQMQPECNIDVWGRGLNDQTALVAELLRCTPSDVVVAVKGNPKAKHEVTDRLLDMAASERRLVLLPRSMSMAEAQTSSLGALTVTGTVGFEAVFGAARCFSLMHPLLAEEFTSFAARDIGHAAELLLHAGEKGRGNVDLGVRLIKRFVQQSFPGLVSDPTSHAEVMRSDNVRAVADGLAAALNLGRRDAASPRSAAGGQR